MLKGLLHPSAHQAVRQPQPYFGSMNGRHGSEFLCGRCRRSSICWRCAAREHTIIISYVPAYQISCKSNDYSARLSSCCQYMVQWLWLLIYRYMSSGWNCYQRCEIWGWLGSAIQVRTFFMANDASLWIWRLMKTHNLHKTASSQCWDFSFMPTKFRTSTWNVLQVLLLWNCVGHAIKPFCYTLWVIQDNSFCCI